MTRNITRSVVHSWPTQDREAWIAANKKGDPFNEGGPASGWAHRSRKNTEYAYNRYLTFLRTRDLLQDNARVGQRFDIIHLKQFAEELSLTSTRGSIATILSCLDSAGRAMDAQYDPDPLRRVIARIRQQARLARSLPCPSLDPVQIEEIAMKILSDAEGSKLSKKSAIAYRDGTILISAAYCPLRRDSWGKIEIGRQLQLIDERVVIAFEATQLKSSRRPFEIEAPPKIATHLHRYISRYRPFLLNGKKDHGLLWVTQIGDPLRGDSLSAAVVRAIAKRSSKHFNFHMFRHSAATFIERIAPEHALIASGVLHHSNFRTAQAHYMRGQRTSAMHAYQESVRQIIKDRA